MQNILDLASQYRAVPFPSSLTLLDRALILDRP